MNSKVIDVSQSSPGVPRGTKATLAPHSTSVVITSSFPASFPASLWPGCSHSFMNSFLDQCCLHHMSRTNGYCMRPPHVHKKRNMGGEWIHNPVHYFAFCKRQVWLEVQVLRMDLLTFVEVESRTIRCTVNSQECSKRTDGWMDGFMT